MIYPLPTTLLLPFWKRSIMICLLIGMGLLFGYYCFPCQCHDEALGIRLNCFIIYFNSMLFKFSWKSVGINEGWPWNMLMLHYYNSPQGSDIFAVTHRVLIGTAFIETILVPFCCFCLWRIFFSFFLFWIPILVFIYTRSISCKFFFFLVRNKGWNLFEIVQVCQFLVHI